MVKAYYSAFGNVDSDGDIIERGAGRKTIKENGPEGKDIIRHFFKSFIQGKSGSFDNRKK